MAASCYKALSKTGHINEQINEEIEHISSLITRKLITSSTPKPTWSILKLLTGERNSFNLNVSSFFRDHNAPSREHAS